MAESCFITNLKPKPHGLASHIGIVKKGISSCPELPMPVHIYIYIHTHIMIICMVVEMNGDVSCTYNS